MQRHNNDRRVSKPPRARAWRHILSHLGIALGAALVFLFWLDSYKQGAMNFMDNVYVRYMTAALGVLAILNGIDLIICKNRAARLRAERDKQQARRR